MTGNVILVVVFFLMGMALLAGLAIGLVIGVALGGDEKSPQRQPAAREEYERLARDMPAAPAFTQLDAGAQERAQAVAARASSAEPQRNVQSWSVALALCVMTICCICVFLMAVLVTLAR